MTISGEITNTTDPADYQPAENEVFEKLYKVTIAAEGTETTAENGCVVPTSADDKTFTLTPGTGGKVTFTKELTFKAKGTADTGEGKKCTYKIVQEKVGSNEPAGWAKDTKEYTLELTAKTNSGTPNTVTVSVGDNALKVKESSAGTAKAVKAIELANNFYGITFDVKSNGGKWTDTDDADKVQPRQAAASSTIGKDTDTVTLPAEPEKAPEDTFFKEWNTAKDGTGTTLTDSTTIQALGTNKTVFAIFSKALVVNFDPNGGKWDSGTDEEKVKPKPVAATKAQPKQVTAPTPSPTKDGFVFKQWCDTAPAEDGETCTNPAKLTDLTAGKTVYASWTKIPVVSFDPNGGKWASGSDEEKAKPKPVAATGGSHNEVVPPQGNTLTAPTGTTFMYWAADKDNPGAYPVNGSNNITVTDSTPKVLYAIYGYKVTYNKATNTGNPIGVEMVPAGHDATGVATKSGASVTVGDGTTGNTFDDYCDTSGDNKTFKEWKIDENTKISKGKFPENVTKDLTLTASCVGDSDKVTVTFKNNKADTPDEIGTQTTAKGAALINIAKKSGADVDLMDSTKVCSPNTDLLKGWKKTAGTGSGDTVHADLTKLTAANGDEYQSVCETAVTITFNYGDGGATTATQKLLKGKNLGTTATPSSGSGSVDLTNETTVCGGDKFLLGWTTDGVTDPITDLTKVTVSSEATYTAKCDAGVTATFYPKGHTASGGGSDIGTEKVKTGGTPTADDISATEAGCVKGEKLVWTPALGPISEDTSYTATCVAKTTPDPSNPPAPQPGGEPSQRPEPSTPGTGSGGSGGSGGWSGWGGYVPSGSSDAGKQDDGKKPQPQKPAENAFDKQFTKKLELPANAVARSAGQDRVATSLSALGLAKNHEVVVLATGSSFPDALVGGALAGAFKAGVVLTTGNTLEQSVLETLKAYKTKTVYIVGGNTAISTAKENVLKKAGLQVVRLAGKDRYATSQAVKTATLQALGGKSAIACNATGSNFPDALACASAASQMGGVVDLVQPGAAVSKDAMSGQTVCAGGPACSAAQGAVQRIVGSDRYDTAYRLAELTPATGKVLVSNGQSYADSLVAGALAGSLNADLVLAKRERVNVPADTKSMHLFGGTQVLPQNLPVYTK